MTHKPLFANSLMLIVLLLAGCSTVGQPSDLDPATGRIKTYSSVTAKVVRSEKINISNYQELILTLGGTFFKEQTIKFGYFKTVVNRADMEKLLIRENKSGIVPDVTNLLSWKKIADNYKPFLVLTIDMRTTGRRDRFAVLKAIQADTATEVFEAEVSLTSFGTIMNGPNDDNVFYPLYNAFIDWVNSNK